MFSFIHRFQLIFLYLYICAYILKTFKRNINRHIGLGIVNKIFEVYQKHFYRMLLTHQRIPTTPLSLLFGDKATQCRGMSISSKFLLQRFIFCAETCVTYIETLYRCTISQWTQLWWNVSSQTYITFIFYMYVYLL